MTSDASDSTDTDTSPNAASASETPAAARDAGDTAGLAEKQAMIDKLFQHTNQFLRDNAHDPLLVVEALAAIVVRYAALLGPVAQLPDRLQVLERLIGQECAQVKHIAATSKGTPESP